MSWGRAEASIVDTGYQRDMRPSWVSPLLHVAQELTAAGMRIDVEACLVLPTCMKD